METWIALLSTIFVWWFATGLILFLDGLPRRTYRWTVLATTLVAALAILAIVISAADASALSAFVAFLAAIAVWGWNEVAFLMGGITGPRRRPCPADVRGWIRFKLAVQTLLWHEALLAASATLLAAATWSGPNKVALWTFLVLWAMRASAKLNIFFGVPNTTREFLPTHLGYLASYFRAAPASLLLPVSIAAGTGMTIWFFARASIAPSASFEEAGATLLAILTALAVIEHLFMIIPAPSATLWAWALRTDSRPPSSRL